MSFFPVIAERFDLMKVKYQTFIDSSRAEYSEMIKNHHSRAISRIGFVSQDKMNIEREILAAILARGVQIGNSTAECIVDAERGLSSATHDAGQEIIYASREWLDDLHLIDDEFVTPVLDQLDVIVSLFQIETFTMLGYQNTVTEIEEIISVLYIESLLYAILFEVFVEEIIFEFTFFETLTNEKNERVFLALDYGISNFVFTTNVIRNSLVNCNV